MNMIKCQICKQEFNNFRSLGSHSTQAHNISKKDYYIKYINSNIRLCELCNNPTNFLSLTKGYSNCCSIKCSKLLSNKDPLYRKNISEKTKLAMQREDVRANYLNAIKKPKSDETR